MKLTRLWQQLFLCILLLWVTACATPAQRLEVASGKLPVPNDTVPLTYSLEESQGSQDACFFTRRTILYASTSKVDEVIEFYCSSLPDSGWELQDKERLQFQFDNSLILSINYAVMLDRSIITEKFPDAEISDEILNTHPTLYEIMITYADPFTQLGCPIWNR